MSILSSKGYFHIEGIEHGKKLTSKNDVEKIADSAIEKIYIPQVNNNAIPLALKVKVGDEVKVGTIIGMRNDFNIPVFSSVSGKIIAEENIFHAIAGRPTKHFVIQNDFKYQKEVLEPIGEDASAEEIVKRMCDAGIVGLGGAGFPTYIKYRNVQGIHTIVINGVECEPYLTTDYKEMFENREWLFKGVQLLIKAAGAEQAVIAFKKDKVDLLSALKEIEPQYPNIKIKTVPDAYPMGYEKTLVKTLLNKTYEKLPSEAGVIVNNAQTAIAVAKACIKGEIVSQRVVTVSGDAIKEPKNILCPIGTKVSELVKTAGGYTFDNVCLLLGGPMTSKPQMNESAAIVDVVGGIIVMKKVVLKAEPCLRCGACTEHCPVGIQPVEIKLAAEAKDLERLITLDVTKCCGCGLCSYICPSKIEVQDFVKKGKMQVTIAAKKAEFAANAAKK